ncbi:alpha-ketoglutarate-dependent dioxygenase AlkB [Actinocorallia sp. API 0066]|uniref:alpha-ketoglutarate-dependent dioxygenase AlkB n=1 Tax=Actinocorallia sp. API 0066 TaxID=2896846 RepID=UPI0027E00063|nr:alpha-ketoglutarate-dependent dioxygenase AlkB [Actinocorallia sp. API 0066]
MMLQGSLLDLADEPCPGELGATVRRTRLSHGAWIDVRPGWLAGSTPLFEELAAVVPWKAERRMMYERVVAVPRLTRYYGEEEALPLPVLAEMRARLSAHYGPELGEPFRTVGLCYYRDGRDSVAWHGDRFGRGASEDTMVALVVLGAPRPLLLRPADHSGPTLRHDLAHGDLLVMGGSCQRTWEHAVPKSAHATGPRISIQFRPTGVRLPNTSHTRATCRVQAGVGWGGGRSGGGFGAGAELGGFGGFGVFEEMGGGEGEGLECGADFGGCGVEELAALVDPVLHRRSMEESSLNGRIVRTRWSASAL